MSPESPEFWSSFAPHNALKLGVAFLCGLLLGLEREHRDKPAGLRTIVLITMGSALFMIVGDLVALVSQGPLGVIQPDPTRIGSQVVTGIGFLGAGSIIQSRGSIHGLTTAATIWMAAAIGLCAGIGFYLTAIATTLFVLIVLVMLAPLTDLMWSRGEGRMIEFLAESDSLTDLRIRLILKENGIAENDIEVSPSQVPEQKLWKVRTRLQSAPMLRLVRALKEIGEVRGVGQKGQK